MESGNSDRPRSTDVLQEARQAAAALVDREEVRLRSRMLAYEMVGAMIGASPIWVRRFVNGYAEAKPDYVVGMSIMRVYQRVTGKAE